MKCRFCQNELTNQFVDLVNSPPSNSFLSEQQLNEPETFFPLRLYVCEQCWLVQLDEYKKADEIFSSEYVYFSSFSESWLEHAKQYVEMMAERLKLNSKSIVIEIASNDGYLLQYFQCKNIPCLGIEPARCTAEVAKKKGIPVICEFFRTSLAQKLADEKQKADLLLGNNVLAHVPDINDFVEGLKIALKADGIVTMEFPHLMQLVEQNQFDTIYHEHFSYFSLHTVKKIFAAHGLTIFDVQELPTHGGSLRIFARHNNNTNLPVLSAVTKLLETEARIGMTSIQYYKPFQQKVDRLKNDLLLFLIREKQQNRKIAAYGAAAKGNTLLNYCGIKNNLISFVADASPYKQGKYLPGSHIPVVPSEKIQSYKPDVLLILPWNIKDEIMKQMLFIRDWGGRFVIPIPEVKVL